MADTRIGGRCGRTDGPHADRRDRRDRRRAVAGGARHRQRTIGRDIGELAGVGTLGLASAATGTLFATADVVIDFTVRRERRPAAPPPRMAAPCHRHNGLDVAQSQAVKQAARRCRSCGHPI